MNPHWTKFASILGVLSLAACSAQADHDYKGEPMMVISGSVEHSEVGLNQDAVPVLGWYAETPTAKEGVGLFARVDVTGEFPNRFSLKIYEPPPPQTRGGADITSDKIAVARILALRDGADWNVDDFYNSPPPDWVLGAAGNFLVWYADEDIPPTPYFRTEDGADAGLARGYNLIRLANWTEDEQAQRTHCFDALKRDALANVNDKHGTAYTDVLDLPEDLRRDYFDYFNEHEPACGHKVKVTVVPTGADHPVSLSFSLDDIDWVDWF